MKKLLSLGIVLAASMVVSPNLTRAEDPKPPGEGEKHGGPHGGPHGGGPAERLKMMTEKLGLTQDQQDKIRAIFEKNAPAIKELMAKGRENLTEADKEKLHEIMKSEKEQIGEILTPEQKAKMKEHMEKRPGGPGGAGEGDKPGHGPHHGKSGDAGRPADAPK